MKERASLFEEENELDLSDFAPKSPALKGQGPSAAQVRAVSESFSFRSREPVLELAKKRGKRPTGRTAHFAAKILPQASAAFYEIAKRQGFSMGVITERALRALMKELEITFDQLGIAFDQTLLGTQPSKRSRPPN